MPDEADRGWATPEQSGAPSAPPFGGHSDAAPPPPPPPPGAAPPPPPPGWGPGGWAAPPRQRLGLIPMYPMGVGDILDTSFKLLRATAGPSVLIVLVLLGPVQVVASLAFPDPAAIFSDPVPAEPDPWAIAAAFGGSLLQLVTGPLAAAALTWLAARTDEGTRPSWTTGLRAGLRRFFAVLGALLLLVVAAVAVIVVAVLGIVLAAAVEPALGVAVAIPMVAVILAVTVLALAHGYLVIPVIVVEERGPIDALRRIWSLVRRRFWPVIGISILAGVVFEFLGGAVSTVFSIPALLPTGFGWVFVAVGSIFDQMISVPLAAFAALALYVDLRIRVEGYDIAVLAAELRR